MAQESYAQTFIDLFDDRIEDSEKEKRELSSTEKDQISGTFPDADKLGEALPELLAKVECFNKSIDNASEKIKQWQDTKKMWQARLSQLLDVLGNTMERLHIPAPAPSWRWTTTGSSSSTRRWQTPCSRSCRPTSR